MSIEERVSVDRSSVVRNFIWGRPVTSSRAGSEAKQSRAMIAGSDTGTAAVNRLTRPCRVTARSMPRPPAATPGAG
ncbi:hypothetical protein ACIBL8_35370 [Streptomyces sp. NPDC050523]|uniref:hypothetical protein n=1 Tax=Streptomyces sp. NPDC050523 TaxID=3365622 RepID=UPI003792F033